MLYRILKETSPGTFTDTGEVFDAAAADLQSHLDARREAEGVSFGAVRKED